jgi:hypothetical protein
MVRHMVFEMRHIGAVLWLLGSIYQHEYDVYSMGPPIKSVQGKLFQEWGNRDKAEWWRGWIQLWYIIRTL